MPKKPDYVDPSTYTPPSGSRRLPIVLCIDRSPSMWNYDRYRHQNDAIKAFLLKIAENARIRETAEIAFVTFADKIIDDTPFKPLYDLTFDDTIEATPHPVSYKVKNETRTFHVNVPSFTPLQTEVCTELPAAILHSHKKLVNRIPSLRTSGFKNYTPFLVVCTDGNPDLEDYEGAESEDYLATETKVIHSIRRFCNNSCKLDDLIFPFFVGIGDQDTNFDHLQQLAANLPDGFCTIKNADRDLKKLKDIFEFMASTISKTVNYTTTTELLEKITTELAKLNKKDS